VGTSDLPTYRQVFVENEYDFSADVQPKVIVDAGANVGLASLYFANKYPESKIIAIEPEKKNFEVLLKNVAPYPNIIALNAALWNKKGLINLVDPGLGSWGFMTEESSQDALGCYLHSVEAVSIDSLIDKFQLPGINILKIDIEGAEKEVFADTSAWIGKVDSIIIELHERMKQGCNRSFYNGSNGFDSEWLRGENVYLSKNGYLRQR
jgi:FkbM family methyltransferase